MAALWTRLTTLVGRAVRFVSLLAAIVVLFALVFAASGQAPAALIILPPERFPQGLPENVRILRWDQHIALVTSDERDYVRRLYKAGAILVLPYRKSGCLALQPQLKAGGKA